MYDIDIQTSPNRDARRRRRHHIEPIVKYARCAFPPFLSLAHSRFSLRCRTPTRYHQFTVFDLTRYFQVSFLSEYLTEYYIFLKMKKCWATYANSCSAYELESRRRAAPPAAMLLNAINIFTSRRKDGMDGREKVRVWGLRLGTVPGIMSAYERVKRQLPPNLP